MTPTLNIIGFFFEIEGTPRSFRTLELTKGFCEAGYKVRLILPNFNNRKFTHPNLEIIETPVGRFLEKTASRVDPDLNRADLQKHVMLLRLLGQKYLFPDINLLWIRNAIKYICRRKIELNADATLAIALPIAPVVLASRLKRAGYPLGKVIAEYGDPNPKASLRGLPGKISRAGERAVLANVEEVVVNFPGGVPVFESLGFSPDKIHVIPHILPDSSNVKKWEQKNEKALHYVYGGAVYGERDIAKLIRAIKQLRKEGGQQTLTILTSLEHLDDSLRAEAGEYLILRQKVSPEEYRKLLINFDAAINFIPSKKVHLPSKRMDFAIVGIPVFEIFCGDSEVDLMNKMREGRFPRPDCENVFTRSQAIESYAKILFDEHHYHKSARSMG
ncbi:MAG: hypothetical protein H6617_03490 [Bdellovibrionaceae bacterium]|nr:hypothetical protein [Bdellovibrionales bacterium]MCB9253723.1 hypothetical protein [Pseudobdellovibrionaceae bacterium]